MVNPAGSIFSITCPPFGKERPGGISGKAVSKHQAVTKKEERIE
jgi:hypothetical protein